MYVMYQYMLRYEAQNFNLSDFKSKFGLKWVKFFGIVIKWVHSRWTRFKRQRILNCDGPRPLRRSCFSWNHGRRACLRPGEEKSRVQMKWSQKQAWGGRTACVPVCLHACRYASQRAERERLIGLLFVSFKSFKEAQRSPVQNYVFIPPNGRLGHTHTLRCIQEVHFSWLLTVCSLFIYLTFSRAVEMIRKVFQ